MDRPRVIIHILSSLDGRLDEFAPDVELYYELAAGFPQDAVLTSSTTLLAAAEREGIDLSGEDPHPGPEDRPGAEPADDSRPWLVIVDSAGRLTRLAWLRGLPYWRDVLVLCSATSPADHLDRLRRLGVEHVVADAERVDLASALHVLSDRYGVSSVRVDAGGTLGGALLSAGLVDEISVVIAPHLVGTTVAQPKHLVDGLVSGEGPGRRATLELTSVERLRGDHVWLRYAVRAA